MIFDIQIFFFSKYSGRHLEWQWNKHGNKLTGSGHTMAWLLFSPGVGIGIDIWCTHTHTVADKLNLDRGGQIERFKDPCTMSSSRFWRREQTQ